MEKLLTLESAEPWCSLEGIAFALCASEQYPKCLVEIRQTFDHGKEKYLAMARAGLAAVQEPTEAMWGGLARDIVMWDRFPRHDGAALHGHLRSIGRQMPDWLGREIPDNNQVPPKGTVAACIWQAMLNDLS